MGRVERKEEGRWEGRMERKKGGKKKRRRKISPSPRVSPCTRGIGLDSECYIWRQKQTRVYSEESLNIFKELCIT